ncbi:MAG: FliM/FliN family flagellar motor switch protein [Deltaproteobacteria bacterium]|nr:FliM/FliN family flagellar motor switch protein [Deltaproteobacteria bacterium]
MAEENSGQTKADNTEQSVQNGPAIPALQGADAAKKTGGNPVIPAYLQELPVRVDVLLGSVKLSIKELLSCGPGSVIDIGKKASEPFDLMVNGKIVARGEVVMMHDRLGLKVVEVVSAPVLPE